MLDATAAYALKTNSITMQAGDMSQIQETKVIFVGESPA